MSHGFSGRPAASDVIAFGNLLAGPADGRGAVGTAFAAGLAADFAAGAVLRVAGLAAVPAVVFAAGFALAFAVAAGLASAAFDLTAFDVASAFAFAALVVFAGFATCRSLNRSYCFGMLARHQALINKDIPTLAAMPETRENPARCPSIYVLPQAAAMQAFATRSAVRLAVKPLGRDRFSDAGLLNRKARFPQLAASPINKKLKSLIMS
ncbi:hypothetical protein NMG46_03095 [Mesorhizobium sp. LMG 17147]|uniref:hypothetical protein n=1 Tax=Mesorhizobium sp. LMG 17147 TaxID=2963091 RepID=UPI0020C95879|nr:hypothetical protein [Mesorhizobium sp. LMG 17147]MCP9229239.1 hypothetical protein [Mesorhizobium sp. LMG 17147]